MLQRVQSLFLLAASILMLMIFAWPLAFYYSESIAVIVNVYQVKTLAAQQGGISVSPILTGFLSLLAIGCAALSVYTIFKFRERLFQIQLARIAVILDIVFIVIVFALTDFIRKKVGIAPDYGTSIFFPVVALLFQLLAMRFIKKDENLVKSTDRLR
ncbi:MAG TPA: hypothetical protein DCR43_07730 [Bacteroidales bacterium]|nr:MAG: hypothetical protein A2X11_14490 [Bacteroidetes bacterium GWE2_42_24]OFY31561.1 MAG: hypothetical protein A2X09_08230 [Bacteroidetes bacterium GWF2_43_11]PKP23565.1 MAG: hypothetical protein CVU06_07615 [Bacteroidetes bacterium HGW-Bacteroidetes-22]HAQ65724.1 hypothetical protein [Bacteroidales bacterium]HBZ67188.1 hypothetical protein [Bacteroidales bacterium]